MAADSQMLFCPGIPGAGKTTLSAAVIDHLHQQFRNDPDVGVAYLYCNFRRHGTQKLDDLVGNLLKQLASARPVLPHSVTTLYRDGGRPSLDKLSSALWSVVAEYSRVFVVVDALDECATAERCRVSLMEQLLELNSTTGVNVFTTSRPVPDIVDMFCRFPSLEIRASSEDVGRYLQGHMGELMPFVARSKDLQERIVTAISHAADGM
jgi:Cdc6-like AAA superfamily ATPase